MKNLKTMLFTSAAAILMLANTSFASAQSFSDVPSGHPQYSAIESLKNLKIVKGYDDNTFRPTAKVTRAESLKMLLTAAQIKLNDGATSNFEDVPGDAWFKSFVDTAAERKIVNGNPDGTFEPNKTVVNAAFWKMLTLVFNKNVENHQNTAAANVAGDISESDWFKKYASYVKTLGIAPLDGSGNLNPSMEVTRGDSAQMIYKLMVIDRGGEAQKSLSIAEVKVIETFLAISLNDGEKAMSLADQAVQFADSAMKLKPNDKISAAAHQITLGARELASAYVAGSAGDKTKMATHTSAARSHAGEAYNFAPQTQPLGKRIKSLADLIETKL